MQWDWSGYYSDFLPNGIPHIPRKTRVWQALTRVLLLKSACINRNYRYAAFALRTGALRSDFFFNPIDATWSELDPY